MGSKAAGVTKPNKRAMTTEDRQLRDAVAKQQEMKELMKKNSVLYKKVQRLARM